MVIIIELWNVLLEMVMRIEIKYLILQKEKISLDLSPSGERIKKLFSKTTALDGFEMLPQRATYTIGLPKTQKLDTPNLDDETCL